MLFVKYILLCFVLQWDFLCLWGTDHIRSNSISCTNTKNLVVLVKNCLSREKFHNNWCARNFTNSPSFSRTYCSPVDSAIPGGQEITATELYQTWMKRSKSKTSWNNRRNNIQDAIIYCSCWLCRSVTSLEAHVRRENIWWWPRGW